MKVKFEFTINKNIIIPPFSPKVCKIILHSLSDLYTNIYNSKVSFKPLSISPLYKNGKPLIKYQGNNNPLMLYAKEPYSFSIVVIVKEDNTFNDIINANNTLRLFDTSLTINSLDIVMKRFDSIMLNANGDYLKIRFVSPTLIQLPSYGRFKRGRHLLFPVPSIMIRSLIDHWNVYAPLKLRVKNPVYASLYSNYMLVEMDHCIKPVTAIYDSKRKPRGFVGWVIYRIRKSRSKYHDIILRMLDYSNYVGIGRSRSTGFGTVDTFILSDKHA